MHDQRDKSQRDYDWMLSTARKQGIQQGIEQGRELGAVIGAIQTLEQILGDPISTAKTLSCESLAELKGKLDELQARVRSRLS